MSKGQFLVPEKLHLSPSIDKLFVEILIMFQYAVETKTKV